MILGGAGSYIPWSGLFGANLGLNSAYNQAATTVKIGQAVGTVAVKAGEPIADALSYVPLVIGGILLLLIGISAVKK
jgi:hypothetical protein